MKGVGAKMKEKLDQAGMSKVKDLVFEDESPLAIKAKLTSISNQSTISLTSLQNSTTKLPLQIMAPSPQIPTTYPPTTLTKRAMEIIREKK